MKSVSAILVATLGLALLTGCSSGLSTITLQGSPSVTQSSVLVDVVGLNANTEALKLSPVPRYWQGGAAQAKGEAKSFRFGPNSPQTYTLAATDPIWKHWHDTGVTEIMVIADLPGVFSDQPGDADARRKILPLSGSATATITVDKAGLVKATP